MKFSGPIIRTCNIPVPEIHRCQCGSSGGARPKTGIPTTFSTPCLRYCLKPNLNAPNYHRGLAHKYIPNEDWNFFSLEQPNNCECYLASKKCTCCQRKKSYPLLDSPFSETIAIIKLSFLKDKKNSQLITSLPLPQLYKIHA